MIKVSIVAPVYGVEKYIEQFLNSIKEQTLQDIEVILVDDGSPDNCPKILDEFASKDDRYKVVHQKNGGVAAARNAGLALAQGQYVYIVDSDDWLVNDAVEKLYEAAIKEEADLAYGNWIREQDGVGECKVCFSNEFTSERRDTIEMLQCAVMTNSLGDNMSSPDFKFVKFFGGAPWRCLIKNSIIRDNNLLYDSYVRGLGDDILFMLHVYEYVKKVTYVNHPIYHYRIVSSSYSHGYKENYMDTVKRIFEKTEDFLSTSNNRNKLYPYYYLRVLIYLRQGIERYYKNSGNPKAKNERYKELCAVLKTEPYRTAVSKAPVSNLRDFRLKTAFLLLRCRLTKVFWILTKER